MRSILFVAIVAIVADVADAQQAPHAAYPNDNAPRAGRRLLDEAARERGDAPKYNARGSNRLSNSTPADPIATDPAAPAELPRDAMEARPLPTDSKQIPSAPQYPFDLPAGANASDAAAGRAAQVQRAEYPVQRQGANQGYRPAALASTTAATDEGTAPTADANSRARHGVAQVNHYQPREEMPAELPADIDGDMPSTLLVDPAADANLAGPATLDPARTAPPTDSSGPAAASTPLAQQDTTPAAAAVEEAPLALAPRGADEAAAGAAKPGLDAKNPLVTMVGSLALVLALFFAVVWVMRRATPASLRQLPFDVVEVLGRTALPGKQQQIHLVRCGNKLLLLASSPQGFNTLGEITDPAEVERLVARCRGQQSGIAPAAFRQTYDEFAREPFGQNPADDALDSPASALSRRMNRSPRLEGSDV